MTVDKELLFKPRLPEGDVELTLEGIGTETFRVRALSRAEVLEVQKLAESGILLAERRILASAIVSPRFTEGEIREWQEAAPAGELEPLTDKIEELSGTAPGAAKATYKEFEADPASEFRVPTGGAIGHDSGPAGG